MQHTQEATKQHAKELLEAARKMRLLPESTQEKLIQRFYGAVENATRSAAEERTGCGGGAHGARQRNAQNPAEERAECRLA